MRRDDNKNKFFVIGIIILLIIGVFVYIKFFNDKSPPKKENQPLQNDSINNSLPLSDNSFEINIQSYKFNPESLRIKAGDTVTWTNLDIVSHTITSDSGSEINSPQFSKDETYSHKFDQKGAYTYHCKLHSRMQGTIIVE
ncbi:hypothetical protein COU57_05595 [Candidatus Pacearchaeota archaeon CG10_big_fil_rev_8_21_14_0_10_32_14]|nr:MAG: hypothetical protein COU57_05595 [Candidatus Pacearchaeota archaeon CG10_big_fil_rev_8_21_14_0_10_32_14]